ncbi:MAG: DUF3048 domain-containing protein [Anaerolineales bacterium]|nr:DUF3048 domain-containing protein [Chloroflexota bacterium]MBL6980768.1 DUF3048 domain-containing protein [Anaerolineales bacterium]
MREKSLIQFTMRNKYWFLIFILVSILTACTLTNQGVSDNPEAASEPTNLSTPTSSATINQPVSDDNNTEPQAPSPTPKPTRTPWPSETPSETIDSFIRIGPNNFPEYINPLTGLPVPNPALLERRPIIAKIPNYPHAVRPQSGISLADQIWEYYLEWGLTRFVGVFYGNDVTRFGPLRSGRIFDEHLLNMYNAIFVFNGADKRTFDYYEEKEVDFGYFVVEQFCPPLCRDDSINSYNNLFGNTSQVHAQIKNRGLDDSRQDLSGNFFSSISGRDFSEADDVYVNYSYANYARWVYDPNLEQYVRYQGSVDNYDGVSGKYELHTDAHTGQPITASNLVILMVTHDFYHKSSDTEVFSIDLTGSGDAFVFRDNKLYRARWHRYDENKPIAMLSSDGRSFPMKPGVTFFQVINRTSEVIQLDQTFIFDFARPPDPED